MDSSPAVPWGNSASFVVWLPNHQGQPVISFIPSNSPKTGIRIRGVKGERSRESPSRRFLAGKRILVSFALLLLAAGATTSTAGCLDEAGDFVWGICAPMFATGVDGDGDLYVHNQLHESADVGSLAGASSKVLWSIKNSGGTTVLALYRNDTTHRYDLAITGQLVTEANFGDYSAVEDYWSLKQDTSYLVALKEAGGGLTDGSLLVAGQALDEATFQCDLEFVKNFTSNYWVKMDRWGHLSKSTDGENYTTLHDFYTDLEQNDAYPVDLELETVVSSTCSVQVRAATAYVMDNKANLYVYDILSSATDIRSVTNAFVDVVDFEIGPSGIDNELYLLRLAGGGTIVNVTGSDFEGSRPWADDGGSALNIELVSNPTVTGGTSGLFVLSNVVKSSSGVIYQLDKAATTEFSSVAMDYDDALAFAASPRSNILMLYQDTNADGTGEMYFYNKKDDTAQAHEFTACGLETLGFDGTATEERFAKLAYQLNHAVLPQVELAPQPLRKVELIYMYGIPISGGHIIQNSINEIISDFENADPASCATFEHVLLFKFPDNLCGLAYNQITTIAIEAAEAMNDASIPFFFRVWEPGCTQETFVNKVNGEIASATLENIISLEYCRGVYMGEVYIGCRLVGNSGNYITIAGDTTSKDYFDEVNRIVAKYNKKLLWHEPSMGGPAPGGGGDPDSDWDKERWAWWGFMLYDTQKFRETVWESTSVVMLHEDNEVYSTGANLDTVYGTWLACDNKSDWGASLQNFWWGRTQYSGDYIPVPNVAVCKDVAAAELNVAYATGQTYMSKYKRIMINPGETIDFNAHTYDIPRDILMRQLLQYLAMGATYIQTEHSAITPDEDDSDAYKKAFKPVLEELNDGKIIVPGKDRIRNQSLVSLALADMDSATQPAKYWANAEKGSIGNTLYLDGHWKFGIFYPSYNHQWDELGFDNRAYFQPNDQAIHWSYFRRLSGWIGDNFENGFQGSGLANNWSEAGVTADATAELTAGFSGSSAQLVKSSTTGVYAIQRGFEFTTGPLPYVVSQQNVFRIHCRLRTSNASANEVWIGYSSHDNTDLSGVTKYYINSSQASQANSDWIVFQSSDISNLMDPVWNTIRTRLWFGTAGIVDATFDNMMLWQKKSDGTYFPRFSQSAQVSSTNGPYHSDQNTFYKGDFFVGDIVDDATMSGGFNEYYGLDEVFRDIGLGTFGAVNSATVTSCSGTQIDIHATYLGIDVGGGTYRAVKDTSRNTLEQSELPLPSTAGILDTPDGVKNRYYARYLHDQDRLNYDLLQKNRFGHVPLHFGEQGEGLPSAFEPVSTNGMDIYASVSSSTVEPYLLGNYVSFFEDRQPITVQTEEDRGVFTSLIVVKSSYSSEEGLYTNNCQLLLLDPIEGGLEISDGDRIARDVMAATVTFNTEHVVTYEIGAATPVAGLADTYSVEIPLFGYQSVDFTTKAR